ncbi:MAG TPA: DUF4870 domain-containing protein, partial [Anaerolineales bacterium]|nr:DUF4870 domain-containing protein [Anaerolineales bacterium]
VLGWSDQRRKSNYASFQCLQALGYQSVGFTVWVLSYLVIIILGAIILIATLGSNRWANPGVLQTPGVIIFFILVFGLFALYCVFPIIAAVACALGKDIRYPIMGDRLARYVGYEPGQTLEDQRSLDEDREIRWVAAMGHFSILIMLWGMLAPLTAWILQGKNNFFLKFQSIQTLMYQAAVTILYFVGGFLYLFGMSLLLVSIGTIGGSDFNSSTGILNLVILGVVFLIAVLVILSVPLLHILGQWAGYRVLKGDDYRYPLIGRLVERWMARQNLRAGAGDTLLKGTS